MPLIWHLHSLVLSHYLREKKHEINILMKYLMYINIAVVHMIIDYLMPHKYEEMEIINKLKGTL